jgi:hypothetical protein
MLYIYVPEAKYRERGMILKPVFAILYGGNHIPPAHALSIKERQ